MTVLYEVRNLLKAVEQTGVYGCPVHMYSTRYDESCEACRKMRLVFVEAAEAEKALEQWIPGTGTQAEATRGLNVYQSRRNSLLHRWYRGDLQNHIARLSRAPQTEIIRGCLALLLTIEDEPLLWKLDPKRLITLLQRQDAAWQQLRKDPDYRAWGRQQRAIRRGDA